MTSIHFVCSLVAALRRERSADASTILRLQQRRLDALLRHAAEQSPFQASRIQRPAGRGIRLEDIRPVDYREMMDQFPETICGARISLSEAREAIQRADGSITRVRGRYLVSQTSGTTGEPGYFLNDDRSWEIQRAVVFARTFRDRLGWQHLRRFVGRRRYRMGFVVSGLSSCISTQTCLEGRKQGRFLADVRLFPAELPMASTVRQLNEFQPDYLHGYANMLELLAYRAEDGELKISPEFISSGSEGFSASGRAAVERVFPAAVITAQYGATECAVLGNECRSGRMHINNDYVVLEAVDEDDRAVPAGERSHHVLLTNLINRFQPVIRLRLTDSITYGTEACKCGSPLPWIILEGRSDEIIWLQRGNDDFVAYQPLSFQAQMYQIMNIRQWQVIQQERNQLLIRYVLAPGADSASVAAQIQQQWMTYLGEERLAGIVRVDSEEVTEVTRSATSQKTKQILSLVGPPAGRSTASPDSVQGEFSG